MVNYQCYRCGYTNKDKSKIYIHLKRKTPCKFKLNNIEIDECREYILEGLSYEEYLKHYNFGKSSVNSHNIPQSTHNMPQISVENPPKIECQFCKNIYSRNDSLNRHLKTCKEKKEEQAKQSMTELVKLLNEQLKEKDKQIDEQNKQISELIQKAGINNSTITQNIQNNIKLLAYKDTDISNLTDKDILKCMSHSNMCVPHLVKMTSIALATAGLCPAHVHFDPKKPENHNVYISNLKNGYIMAYNGSKWDTLNRDEIIEDIISDKQGLIEERIENWIEKGKKYPTIMKKFERYLEKKEINIVINKIKEEIKLMLFNNRTVVKK